jgi:transcriptional repressor NrdR
MKCPSCGNMETKVLDSRVVDDGRGIRRRRSCEYCEQRFSTMEKIVVTDLVIVKKDGSKELYDRDKLKKALVIAFGKKNISTELIEDILTNLEAKWLGMGKELTSKKIGEDVLHVLKSEDEVAYLRFASVFMEFEGIADFKQWIDKK